jgi:acyl transferase domain-containing protein
MVQSRTAVLFPGQGSLSRSTFARADVQRYFREVLEEIGSAAGDCRPRAQSPQAGEVLSNHLPDAPHSLAISIFAASVAQYRLLEDQGLRPVVMIGHGFGEIIALVCAGALSPAQGAEIVSERAAVLNECSTHAGGMLVARTTKPLADTLVELAGSENAAVAAENSPTEVVISGTAAGIERIERFARYLGIAVTRLRAYWPLHCRAVMMLAATELKKRLSHLSSQPLRVPVFSPTLGRCYGDADNLTGMLSGQLALPVRFADAIRYLLSTGVEAFIECGPLYGLGRCVQEIAGGNRAPLESTRFELPRFSQAAARPGHDAHGAHPAPGHAGILAN